MTTELEQLCIKHHITAVSSRVAAEAGAPEGWRQWKVTLQRADGRTRTLGPVPFGQGSGHKHPPTAADVLSCLLLDARLGRELFVDYCVELGESADSRKALDVYLKCQDTARALWPFLGDALPAFEAAEH